MDGVDDFTEFAFGIFSTHLLKNLAGFVDAVLRDQPARTGRNSKEQDKEEGRREGSDSQLPAPLARAQIQDTDDVVGEIGEQNTDDDVDLEHADEAAAHFSWSEFRDIDRSENRGTTDADAADEACDK